MSLDLNMMNASVRIVGDVPDKTIIGYHRGVIGSGFMVAVPSEADPNAAYGYVVTAHHVLDGQPRIEVEVPDPLTIERENLLPPVEVTDWRQPLEKVDLALAPFRSDVENDKGIPVTGALRIKHHFLPANYVPPLGGTAHYIGVFEPLNRMMVRSGTLGALFQGGVTHRGDYEYHSHLVDCRSYDGFSGSPCYVEYTFAKLTASDRETFPFPVPPVMESEFPLSSTLDLTLLCGMFTEYIEDKTPGEIVSKYGVGIMLPSLYIWMALYSEELVAERREWDKVDEPEDEPVVRKASVAQAETDREEDEVARFEALAQKLANTPNPQNNDSDNSSAQAWR